MRPVESNNVSGSWRRSVEHWRSNSTRRPSTPAHTNSCLSSQYWCCGDVSWQSGCQLSIILVLVL